MDKRGLNNQQILRLLGKAQLKMGFATAVTTFLWLSALCGFINSSRKSDLRIGHNHLLAFSLVLILLLRVSYLTVC